METKSVSKIYTLNKTTYINLRWIAILGQFFTVNIAKYVFNFEFDILTNLLMLRFIAFKVSIDNSFSESIDNIIS